MNYSSIFRPTFAFLMILAGSLAVTSVAAQSLETLAGAETSWSIVADEVDCGIVDGTWKQTSINSGNAESQQFSELIEFTASSGGHLMVAHSVTPAFVIPELTAAVMLKSERRGVQLHARVILPHNQLANGQPMTVILNGPVSKQQGRDERLSFSGTYGLNKLLQDQLWLLRSKHNREVTLRDAFVDQLWLNVFTGKGETKVQIDGISMSGVVDATQVSQRQAVTDNTAPR